MALIHLTRKIGIAGAGVLALALATPAGAAGDPEAGAEKSTVCASCHGGDGNSQISEWPKLAGQHADYTAHQTRMVRDQVRDVPQMYPMVMNLSDQDIADIAAYYAEQTVAPGVADEELVDIGRRLYHGGNHESGVPACMGCHGPAGAGIPGAHFPALAGQHADYSANRLRRYRDGELNDGNDPYSAIMAVVTAEMTDEEIEAVSSYIEGLHRAR